MNTIPRGRERRLKDRFSDFDDYRNSRAWAIAVMMVGPLACAGLAIKFLPLPGFIIVSLLVGSVFCAFIGSSVYANLALGAFARKNGLTCSHCNSPLVHTGLMDTHHASNYRRPYTIPMNCRSCGISINDAVRPKNKE